ncbi:FHA domain-containing protein [Paraburkholderia sp. MMS20-SJTN17]|uniref:FHA domain-containing protein n=1 Tax=Paraburkholderia translucens TaxID=2886945 RepID=A0ABS8K6W6_9BURK|nr:FHA domain-containing protein [Paraburkholderia sp. MMS20-SJTN17]MCC8400483.1 FHA domain-containing protein [Paraburkholderia sp. MMS20-SJTN17]
MSNKPFRNIFGQIWGGGLSPGSGRSETVCPNGHPMDPSWTRCPRCDAENRANERSSEASSSYTFDDSDSRGSTMSSHKHTVISGESTSSDASATREENSYESSMSSPSPSPRRSSRRKITGVLVTFTWERQGDLFVLYEGRNVIGKGTVESENGRPCDVLLPIDATMSNEHALILCRAGRYELFDNRSTNGTYADDQFVESAGVMLRDGARIKTGDTVWLFRQIDSGDAPAHPGHERGEEPQQREPQSRRENSQWNEARAPHRPSRDDSRIE